MRGFKWLMIISLILMTTVNAYAAIDVSMQSDVAQPIVGTQFTVTAYCQGADTVASMSLKFNFDRTMIQAVSVTDIKGGFTVPDATAIANANSTTGVLTFSFASISSPWTFTGNEAVASVTFAAQATTGNTTIDPSATTIKDNTPPPAGPIDVTGTLAGVTVTIKLGPDTAGPIVTPVPTTLSKNTIFEGEPGVDLTGTITDGQSDVDSYQWARNTSAITPPTTGTDVDVNPNANPHNFTISVGSENIPAGEYYFWVRGKDDSADTPGGNWGAWQVSEKLTVQDNPGPQPENVTTNPVSPITEGATVDLEADLNNACPTCSGQNVIEGEWAESATQPAGSGTSIAIGAPAPNVHVTVALGAPADGTHKYWVRGKDAFNVWGPWVSTTLVVNPNNGPDTTNVAANPTTVVQGELFDITATITSTSDRNVTDAEYYVGAVPPTDGSAPDFPAFAGGSPVNVTASNVDSSALAVGQHNVWVRGQDGYGIWGPWAKAATKLTVNACDVAAAFSYTPVIVETGVLVTYQNDSTENGAGPFTYDWDLDGDGTYEITGVGKVNQTITYNTTGTVNVKLKAHGSAGCSTEASQDVDVICDVDPSFTADDTEIIVEGTVTFTNTSTGSGAPGATYDWDFGDGNNTNGAAFGDAINNQYMAEGEFDVNLTAHGTGCDPTDGPLTITVLPCDAQADFDAPLISTADEGTGAAATVKFTDKSTFTGAAAKNWIWDFKNDGSVDSFDQNPSHNFVPGSYIVVLTVRGSTGCTTRKLMEIFVNDPACEFETKFHEDKTTVEINENVIFTDDSDYGGSSPDRRWSFGDLGASTLNPMVYSYTEPGTYNVVLGAKDGSCPTYKYAGPHKITVTCDVIANFDAPATAKVGEEVTLTNTSTGSQADASKYDWDLDGDGVNDIQDADKNDPIKITPTQAGTYNIKMVAKSPNNCTTEITKTVTVTSGEEGGGGPGGTPVPPKPDAQFDVDPTSGNAPLEVTITDKSKITAGSIVEWKFDFGDGTQQTFTEQPVPFTHEYTSDGQYTITLKVSASNGQKGSTEQKVSVGQAEPPVASFKAEPEQGEEPLNVKFTDTSTGDITSRKWTIDGIGEVGNGDQQFTYEFTTAGTYTVTLEVTGPGGSDSATRTITVTPDDLVTADFSFVTDVLIAEFTDLSTGNIVTWAWDFGDGATSGAQNPTHTYNASGTYPVTLTVTDDDGDQASAIKDVTVSVPSVTAQFTAVPTEANVNDVISFTDQSTGNIQTRLWNFGDGTTSSDVNPTHSYAAPGKYTVSLTVTGFDGTSDTETKTDYITIIQVGPGVEPPTPISPANGATEVPLEPQLCVEEMSGVESVTFQVSFNDSNFDEESLAWTMTVQEFCTKLLEMVLEPGTTYCWRAQFKYTDGTISPWSQVFCFTTVQTNPDDEDGSGVPNEKEPTEAEKKQHFPDVNFGELAKAIYSASGDVIFAVEGVENVSSVAFLNSYPVFEPLPSGCSSMPWGLIGFRLGVANPGDTVKVVIHFSEAISGPAAMYIYDTIEGLVGYDNAVFSEDMKSVTVTLTDGSSIDRDGLKNGIIVISYAGFCFETTTGGGGGGGGNTCFIGTAAGSGIGFGLTALAGIASALIVRRKRRK